MVKRPILYKVLLIGLALCYGLVFLSGSVSAQSYSFKLPSEEVDMYISDQGIVSINYVFNFQNNPGAPAIEYVDVGLPNQNYDIGSIKADINGNPITNIQKADPKYVPIGVTLGLGSQSIPAGASGQVHLFVGTVTRMLYPYKYGNTAGYASFQFSPNYFDSSALSGNTDLTVRLHLPPGIQSQEPIYYNPTAWPGDSAPEAAYDSNNSVVYTWHSNVANGYTKYTFGGAFPAKYVPASAISSLSIWEQLGIKPEDIFTYLFYLGCAAFLIGIPVLSWIGNRNRKLAYLPPKISIEGHGIKRGLTAVEAAILMEQPLDKVLTMVLFGIIKKGGATVTTRDPLELTVTSPAPEGLQPYEVDFLAAFSAGTLKRKAKLQEMVVTLVKNLSEKMKGFSRKETVAYYQDIMKKAWTQVEEANTPEVKSQKFDENLEWTMLDKEYDHRTRTVFGPGPVFVPIWWGRFDPGYHGGPAISSTPGVSSAGSGRSSMPTLPGSDFAAGIVNGVSGFSSKVIGDVTGFTSGITNKTNPAPVSTSSSGSGYKGGGGGGGTHCVCACACACAGCACACAGGGR